MARIDWKSVLGGVDKALDYFQSQDIKPTLRTLFYWLVSKTLIPNTHNAFTMLSRRMVDVRKKGRFAWDCIEDKTRNKLGDLYDGSFDPRVTEKIERILNTKLEAFSEDDIPTIDDMIRKHFNNFDSDLIDFRVMRWAEQPTVCEIWIEKEALASTIKNWTEKYQIPINVCRGYDSWTNIYTRVLDLESLLKRNHKKVIIFYLGDLDPSGVDIDRFLMEALEFFNLDKSKIEFKRLAITEEQVEKYRLPPRPEDAETLAKLNRDSRMKTYDKTKPIVELDALVAYVPDNFRKEIEEAIQSVWDENIYTSLMDESKDLESEVDDLIDETVAKAKEKVGIS